MPTVTPLPSTPKLARAPAASSWVSPSETTGAARGRRPRTIGVEDLVHPGDAGDRGERRQLGRLAATVTVW